MPSAVAGRSSDASERRGCPGWTISKIVLLSPEGHFRAVGQTKLLKLPEVRTPPGPTNVSNTLSVEQVRASTRCQRNCQRLRPAVAQRVCGATQVARQRNQFDRPQEAPSPVPPALKVQVIRGERMGRRRRQRAYEGRRRTRSFFRRSLNPQKRPKRLSDTKARMSQLNA